MLTASIIWVIDLTMKNTTAPRKYVTLTNNFHGTECRVLAAGDATAWDAWTDASPRVQRRIRRELCGAEKGTCTCGVVRMSTRDLM